MVFYILRAPLNGVLYNARTIFKWCFMYFVPCVHLTWIAGPGRGGPAAPDPAGARDAAPPRQRAARHGGLRARPRPGPGRGAPAGPGPGPLRPQHGGTPAGECAERQRLLMFHSRVRRTHLVYLAAEYQKMSPSSLTGKLAIL